MPVHKQPSTDESMTALLSKAVVEVGRDQARGIAYLSDADVATVTNEAQRFGFVNDRVEEYRTERKHAVAQANRKVDSLKGALRIVWHNLNNSIHYQQVPETYRSDFGLPDSGEVPDGGRREVWFARADKTLRGGEKLMQDGYILPFNIDLLRNAYNDAQFAYGEVETLKGQVQAVEDERRLLRRDVKDACLLLFNQLRFALRRKAPETARAIMRRYGFVYTYAPGEEALAQAEAPSENRQQSDDSTRADDSAHDTAYDSAYNADLDTGYDTGVGTEDGQHRLPSVPSTLGEGGVPNQNGTPITE